MKKKHLIGIAVIIVVALALAGGWYFFIRSGTAPKDSAAEKSEVTYRCDGGSEISASFSTGQVSFSLSDGRSFNLLEIPSASGSKFTNRDGSIILWTKDYSAFLEENDDTTYTGCRVYPLSFPSVGQ